MRQLQLVGLVLTCASSGLVPWVLPSPRRTEPPTVWIRTRDGLDVEGWLGTAMLTFTIGGATRQIAAADLLSVHSAAAAAAGEAVLIEKGLAALAGTDFKAAEAASAQLTDIGMPVLTPLLASYVDTDAHEPDARYRLFARIVPGHADVPDRSLDLIRLTDGTVWRGTWQPIDLPLQDANGKVTTVPAAAVRRIAVRRVEVARTFELQALRHCTYVGWLDTGVAVTAASTLRADAEGFVRLSFAEDGWATGPKGLQDTLPGKRKLQEGFRWGAVLGRVGPGGERWFVGSHCEKEDLGVGRLFVVVNDNEHWQNNIGSYRVRLAVSNAYDLGEPQ